MFLARRLFNGQSRINSYRWLARVLDQGRMLVESVHLMYAHASDDGERPGRARARALAAWSQRLSAGNTFADAVADWVPPSHRMLLEAGEKAKTLPNALEVCAWLEESSATMRRTMIGALASPLGLLLFVLGVYVYFGLNVFPEYHHLVPQEQWEVPASYMPGIFWFILEGPLVVCVAALFLFSMFMLLVILPRWTSPMRSYLEWWMPFRYYRMFSSCFFLIGLTGLLRAKSTIDDALVTLQTGQPPWVRSRLQMIKNQLLFGREPGDAFWMADRRFPSIEINRELRIVFTFQAYDEIIYRMAQHWVAHSIEQIEALSRRLRLFAQALNGILMAQLVFSLMQISSQVRA